MFGIEDSPMTRRSGSADLPLHGGRVPAWLGERMTRLGTVISQAVIHHYGRDELLARLAHPFWFQSFGAVMGMDWHSSGITTSVLGALKRGLTPLHGIIVNLTDRRAEQSRGAQLDLLDRLGPDRITQELARIEPPAPPAQPLLPHLVMPAHHEVRATDVNLRRLRGNLAAAADRG